MCACCCRLGWGAPAFAEPPSTSTTPQDGALPARLLEEVAPVWPPGAGDAHGDVVVLVTVGTDGAPTAVVVESGPEVFRASALAAAEALRFVPATLDGVAVETRVAVSFHFAPPEAPPVDDAGLVETVEVHAGHPDQEDPHASTTLDAADLARAAAADLAETVAAVPGVTLARGTADVSKPIIRGQSERRLLLLVDGVRHESQKWGPDHAPEIDPFAAGAIRVVRGAAGARYGPDAIGGVILVTPPPMRTEPGVGGTTSWSGATNGGRGWGALRLDAVDGKVPTVSWRLEGNYGRGGSLSAPGYVLGNTGSETWDLGAAVGWQPGTAALRATWHRYSLRAGVFYGQRAGTPQDFEEQLLRDEPVNAELWDPSYAIDRPSQAVTHDVFALHAVTPAGPTWTLTAIGAFQLDQRREFDQVRDADTAGAQYDFLLRTLSLDAALSHADVLPGTSELRGGLATQGVFQENVYRGLPLLPNYRSLQGGVAGWERVTAGVVDLEAAARLDLLSRTAFFGPSEYAVHERRGALGDDRCAVTEVLSTCPDAWRSGSASVGGVAHLVPERLDLKLDLSSAGRFPNVDELYLTGSAPTFPVFALGAPDLRTEKTAGGSATGGLRLPWMEAELSAFASRSNDYIWFAPALTPSGEPAFDVTIRGTFPRWEYRQVDADFHGADGRVELGAEALLGLAVQGAIVRARERATGTFLVGTPADHGAATLFVRPPGRGWLHDPVLSARVDGVARQSRVDPSLDFAPPPAGYALVGLSLEATVRTRSTDLRLGVDGTNLTNTRYREYTSLTRYFADQPGRDVRVRLSADF